MNLITISVLLTALVTVQSSRPCTHRNRTPRHGVSVAVRQDSENSVYAITCAPGFVLKGPGRVTCHRGQLIGSQPKCLPATTPFKRDKSPNDDLRSKRDSLTLGKKSRSRQGKSLTKNKNGARKTPQLDYDEEDGEGGGGEIRSPEYNEVYGTDQYDYKTDYEDVDYSYDNGNGNGKKKKKEEEEEEAAVGGKDGDPDYGDFYDYNYEQSGGKNTSE